METDADSLRVKFSMYEAGYQNGYSDARTHFVLFIAVFICSIMIARSISKIENA